MLKVDEHWLPAGWSHSTRLGHLQGGYVVGSQEETQLLLHFTTEFTWGHRILLNFHMEDVVR